MTIFVARCAAFSFRFYAKSYQTFETLAEVNCLVCLNDMAISDLAKNPESADLMFQQTEIQSACVKMLAKLEFSEDFASSATSAGSLNETFNEIPPAASLDHVRERKFVQDSREPSDPSKKETFMQTTSSIDKKPSETLPSFFLENDGKEISQGPMRITLSGEADAKAGGKLETLPTGPSSKTDSSVSTSSFLCQGLATPKNAPPLVPFNQTHEEEEFRIWFGNNLFRQAMTVFLLVDVFGTDPRDSRIQRIVKWTSCYLYKVQAGTEIGLVWPVIVIGSEAYTDHDRNAIKHFIHACQWKGSSATRVMESILEKVWKSYDENGRRRRSLGWRHFSKILGCPLLL
ncbi:hypothetical protein IE53DRAFT_214044 [Violaceomyces palustris]|uniref:Uncharacterized protein n=1 Tax=Violaceomyces palustris TaxID=1673888 RepID=A0ACD0NQQ5_9BASI|nr:hypothetical protein IE53DRAFT_214044 [Violaceomyces palustris]